MTTIGLTYSATNLSGNQKNAIVRVISLRNKIEMGYLRMIWVDIEAVRTCNQIEKGILRDFSQVLLKSYFAFFVYRCKNLLVIAVKLQICINMMYMLIHMIYIYDYIYFGFSLSPGQKVFIIN